MFLRYVKKVFVFLLVFIGMLSCAENNVPITANNKLITNTIKDSVTKADYQEGKALFVANCDACHKGILVGC